MRVWTGTSGYSYPEWKGNFYPEKLATKDMLRFYAERFPTVEINNTFYRMPKEGVVQNWAEQVPDGFVFVIKAPRRITQGLKEVEQPLARFLEVVSTMGPRLGPLLFQLPPTFRKDLPKLQAFLDLVPEGRRVAVEFRNASWFDDEVFALLQSRNAALCVADLEKRVAAPLVATADWGYLRLRREGFTDEDLQGWAHRILEQPWTDAFVFLKHEEDGMGPKLAARLAEICRA